MATIKYFSGETEVFHPYGMPNAEFASKFPGSNGIKSDSFSRYVGIPAGGNWKTDATPIDRRIEFKSNPSMHVCDARCMNAKGRSCECSCGGKNHGAGSFICAA